VLDSRPMAHDNRLGMVIESTAPTTPASPCALREILFSRLTNRSTIGHFH